MLDVETLLAVETSLLTVHDFLLAVRRDLFVGYDLLMSSIVRESLKEVKN